MRPRAVQFRCGEGEGRQKPLAAGAARARDFATEVFQVVEISRPTLTKSAKLPRRAVEGDRAHGGPVP
jgi:hypothetical protein